MNLEDRLRDYLVEKASTLDVTPRLEAETRTSRSPRFALGLAAALTLLIVGVPLIFVVAGNDENEAVSATTSPATTAVVSTSAVSAAQQRFDAITEVSADGVLVPATFDSAHDADIPVPVQALTPVIDQAVEMGELVVELVGGEEMIAADVLVTGSNSESGVFSAQWVSSGAATGFPDRLCLAVVDGAVANSYCAATFGLSDTSVPVFPTATGVLHVASAEIPLEAAYVVLSSTDGSRIAQVPIAGSVLFAVEDGSYEMVAYDAGGKWLADWRVVAGRVGQSVAPLASCGETGPAQPAATHLAFYAECADGSLPFPIYRRADEPLTLQQSLEALLAGTASEEADRLLQTGFDALDRADEVMVSARINGDGIAVVSLLLDGSPWQPDTANWASSQLDLLLSPLFGTVFSHDDVRGLDMAGLCLPQVACDYVLTRVAWQGMLFENYGILSHDGCTPELAWFDPRRCTVAGALEGPMTSAVVARIIEDDTLRIRTGPDAAYTEIGGMPNGTALQVTNTFGVASDGDLWRLVDGGAQGIGWVHTYYLEVDE